MYTRVSSSFDFAGREKEVLDFWKEERVFEKSRQLRKGCAPYTFFDGPPTANGKPHIGHILTRCYKDVIPRHRSMKGYDVLRKAGWDTHGLPVELEVEKQLGLDGKEQIEKYGIEAFINKCKESVWTYKGEWERISERVGFWADMDDPYVTYTNEYIESVWWSLKQIHQKGLLYKGHKVVPYCPRCGTALSSHEVAQGYQETCEPSVYVKFKVRGAEEYLLAWTTTPWTLPSNLSLCVNAGETYAKARSGGEVYIMAKALVPSVLGEDAEIIEEMPGKALVNMDYEPLFDFIKVDKRAWFVVADDYVTLADGTGIVHQAPAFGEDDARVCAKYNLPFVQPVDEQGCFRGGTPWDGVFVKLADPMIAEHLAQTGQLYKTEDYKHNYPFCWRCDTPLLYYARSSWFIRMSEVKDKLMAFNRSVNWLPDNIKEGRMGNFVENVIDWSLSRERYWGTPLPVWTCACGNVHVIGSVEELKRMGKNVPADIELHKPFIDAVKLVCPDCGGEMTRESAVIDCWFDSGAMPFAQWHYPFENNDIFADRYPAQFISEAIDQTRGWFYTLLAISTCLFDEAAFQNCIVLGHVLDKDGQKMSKHKGNVVDPWSVLDKQGADAVRWYFYTNSSPWLPSRFYEEAVSEFQRKFMGTLWNTYAFYILYAEIDAFDPAKYSLEACELTVMDKWILSRLESTVQTADAALDALKITEAGREMQRFVDELSNWYVRRCRERFWGSGMTADKQAAFMTLYTVLERFTRLIAPMLPFIAESMYQNLVRSVDAQAPVSVHLTDYPSADKARINEALESGMDMALRIVVLGRAARNAASRKNRQPLSVMYVQAKPVEAAYVDIVAEELNVKRVEFTDDASAYMAYRIKPQLRTLGQRFGKLLPKISEALAGIDGAQVVAAFARGESVSLSVEGQDVILTQEDTLIEPMQKAGFVTEQDRELAIALDANLTEELIEEGFVREIVSKVQTMRKEAGFYVTDKIVLTHQGSARIAAILDAHGKEICAEVLAQQIVAAEPRGFSKPWDINGESVTFGVEKV